MANTGTSKSFTITGSGNYKLAIKGDMVQLNLSDLESKPPQIGNGYKKDIEAIEKSICIYPDIAFEKIILPQFDGIARYTGHFSNQPDFIKDYHIISLMRLVDRSLMPTYKAQINSTATTPTFSLPS